MTPTSSVLLSEEPFSLEHHYADRQQIVIVPDEVVEAERHALKQLDVTKEGADIEEIVRTILAGIAGVALREYVLPLAVAELIVRGVMKLREKGIEVLMVGRSEADSEGVRFQPGPPLDRVVYIGHPNVPAIYYPAAEFHRRVFDHKFCELVDLLLTLGASNIVGERQEGFGREEAAQLDVSLTPKERLGGRLKRTLGRESQANVTMNAPGNSTPYLPEDLVWFQSERMWQTLARARMQHGVTNFSLVLRYENDYGITGSLKGKIEGVKLDVGGNFQEQQDTIWKFSADFPPVTTAALMSLEGTETAQLRG